MSANLYIKMRAQELQKFYPVNKWIDRICLACNYKYGPKEINEDSIDKGIMI